MLWDKFVFPIDKRSELKRSATAHEHGRVAVTTRRQHALEEAILFARSGLKDLKEQTPSASISLRWCITATETPRKFRPDVMALKESYVKFLRPRYGSFVI